MVDSKIFRNIWGRLVSHILKEPFRKRSGYESYNIISMVNIQNLHEHLRPYAASLCVVACITMLS